jgi:hypothetical protein
MNNAPVPIPAFAQTEPPTGGDIGQILARAERAGIAPERVLLALGYPPGYAGRRQRESTATAPAGPLAQQVNGTQSTAS